MSTAARHPPLDAEGRRLEAALLDWIAVAPPGFVRDGASRAARYGLDPEGERAQDRRFEGFALDLFAYQYERIPIYRAYADATGRTPARVRTAAQVPPLPVEAFKRARIAAFPPTHERAAFHTSGTSTGTPGVLHLETLDLYDLALERGFRHHVLPDLESIRMLSLVPDADAAPGSSLAYMLARVRERWGAAGSSCAVRDGVLQWTELRAALESARAAQEPLCLLGTAFGWAAVLERCAGLGFEILLPPRSRIFETGGFKGRGRVLEPAVLYAAIEQRFGVPVSHIVSEYGMTEMASQYYTLSLRRALLDEPPGDASWSYPAWLRPRCLEAESGRALETQAAPEIGLLAHHDLANRGSVAHLLSADLGRPCECSFELAGRCPQADLRGCGLADEARGGAPILPGDAP